MYDQLRNEYDSMKRSAIEPANNFFSRNEPDLFSNHAATMMDNRNPIWKGKDFHFKMTIGQHRLWLVP
jgi:E3 ubiquitin-protein ligase CCNP1IP1